MHVVVERYKREGLQIVGCGAVEGVLTSKIHPEACTRRLDSSKILV
jgi:hypothetical protein